MRAAIVLVGAAAVLVLAALSSCPPRMQIGSDRVKPGDWEKSLADPWVKPLVIEHPDVEKYPGSCIAIADSSVRVVLESKQAAAQGMLSERWWVELTPERARELAGRSDAFDTDRGKIVLLRCAQVTAEESDEPSRRRVLWDGGTVSIESSAIRMNYVPVEHVAIVAVLPGLPTEVFVSMPTVIY
jgi:hypothetical protein